MSGILIYNQPHLLSKILFEFGGLCSKTASAIKKEVKINEERKFYYHCIIKEPFYSIKYEREILFGKRKFITISREYSFDSEDDEEEDYYEPYTETYFFREIINFKEFENFTCFLQFHLEQQEIEELEFKKKIGKITYYEYLYLRELQEDSFCY